MVFCLPWWRPDNSRPLRSDSHARKAEPNNTLTVRPPGQTRTGKKKPDTRSGFFYGPEGPLVHSAWAATRHGAGRCATFRAAGSELTTAHGSALGVAAVAEAVATTITTAVAPASVRGRRHGDVGRSWVCRGGFMACSFVRCAQGLPTSRSSSAFACARAGSSRRRYTGGSGTC